MIRKHLCTDFNALHGHMAMALNNSAGKADPKHGRTSASAKPLLHFESIFNQIVSFPPTA